MTRRLEGNVSLQANTRPKGRRGVERVINAATIAAGTLFGSCISVSAEPNASDRERFRKAASNAAQATVPVVADDLVRLAEPKNAALQGLRRVGLSDLQGYKSYISAGNQMGFGYYFPYLLARNAEEDSILLGQEEGSVCVFLRRDRPSGPHLDLFLAPAPMNSKALLRCLERANDYNGDYSARVLKIDEQDFAQLSCLRHLRIEKRREQYIYCPHSFRDISGNRFRTLRRNVAMVETLRDVDVVPFASEHAQGCLKLLRRWSRRHSHEHNTAGGVGTAERVIKLAGFLPEPDLGGELVFIGGKLSAFSFGGEIRPGLGCYIEAKSDFDIPGLSYFQRRHFLCGLNQFEFVNDGSNAARPGLKQLKDSMRPITMHGEYIARQQTT